MSLPASASGTMLRTWCFQMKFQRRGPKDLVKGADGKYVVARGRNPNAARDLKRSPWFPQYLAKIPVWNPRKQEEEVKDIPFLLAHELMGAFLKEHRDLLLQTSGLCKQSKEHLLHVQRGFEAPEALATGLWSDGTPYKFDRSQTLECICLNFPGLGVSNARSRPPLCAIPKRWCNKGKTLSKMLGVLARSSIHLANAGFAAFLAEVRGDWATRKEVFSFPG